MKPRVLSYNVEGMFLHNLFVISLGLIIFAYYGTAVIAGKLFLLLYGDFIHSKFTFALDNNFWMSHCRYWLHPLFGSSVDKWNYSNCK